MGKPLVRTCTSSCNVMSATIVIFVLLWEAIFFSISYLPQGYTYMTVKEPRHQSHISKISERFFWVLVLDIGPCARKGNTITFYSNHAVFDESDGA